MTMRLKGVLVTFEDDVREDDAQARIGAIRQIRGVLSVEAVPADIDDFMARQRVKYELWASIRTAFFPERKQGST